jgi:BirA family biotin operon repressor/biotin-[acetyl-CoA-carboxylase] ligase
MGGKRLTPPAQELRRNMTDAARRLWSHLRAKQLGVQFTRQYQIGNAIADFACRRLKLVVEVDGGQHSDSPTDDDRTREIEAHGYQVIRFWNHDVLTNTDGVLTRIAEEIALARNE